MCCSTEAAVVAVVIIIVVVPLNVVDRGVDLWESWVGRKCEMWGGWRVEREVMLLNLVP